MDDFLELADGTKLKLGMPVKETNVLDQGRQLAEKFSAFMQTGMSNPDEAARDLESERILGIEPGTLTQNPELRQQAFAATKVAQQNPDTWDAFAKDNPKTANWLNQGGNIAVAHDDTQALSGIEKAFRVVSDAYRAGELNTELSKLGFADWQGQLTDDKKERMKRIHNELGSMSNRTPLSPYSLEGATNTAVGMAPMFIAAAKRGLKIGLPAAGVAASMSGPGAIPAAAAAGSAGFAAGTMMDLAEQFAGSSYLALKQLRSADNTPINENAARIGAMFIGIASAGLGGVQLRSALKGIPGAEKILDTFLNTAAKEQLTQPALSQAMYDFGVGLIKTAAEQSAVMAGFKGTELLGEQMAVQLTNQTIVNRDQRPAWEQIGTAAAEFFPAGMIIGLPGRTMGLGRDIMAKQRAENNAKILTDLSAAVQGSKLPERSLTASQEYFRSMVEDGPVKDIYIPAEEFTTYFQSAKLDPAKVADELGISEQFADALMTGADLKIPMDTALAKLVKPGHFDKLISDMKFNEGDFTLKQIMETHKQAVEDLKKLDEEGQPAELSPRRDEIYNRSVQTLVDGGIPEKDAKIHAQLPAAFAHTMEKRYPGRFNADDFMGKWSVQKVIDDAKRQGETSNEKTLHQPLNMYVDPAEKVNVVDVSNKKSLHITSANAKKFIEAWKDIEFINTETGWKASLSKTDADHAFWSSDITGRHNTTRKKSLSALDELIAQAARIETYDNKKTGKNKKETDLIHRFYVPVNNKGKLSTVRIVMVEKDGVSKVKNIEVYDVIKERTDPAATSKEVPKSTTNTAADDMAESVPNTITIRQMLANVKDANGNPYFDANGNPVYHQGSKIPTTARETLEANFPVYAAKPEALDIAERAINSTLAFGQKPIETAANAIPTEPAQGPRKLSETLGLGFMRSLVRDGVATMVGKTVRTPHELGVAAQVLRHPGYETMHIIFVKNGKVVHHEAVSSRLPDQSSLLAEGQSYGQFLMNIHTRIITNQADGYYFVHNHPSGKPEPSREDINLTRYVGNTKDGTGSIQNPVYQGFKGHVVINSGKFAVIDRDGNIRIDTLKTKKGEQLLVPEIPHELLGTNINDPKQTAVLAKSIQMDPNQSVVFYLNTKNEVRGIQVVSDAVFGKGGKTAERYLRYAARAFGSTNAVVVTGNQKTYAASKELIKRASLLDAYHVDLAATARENGTPYVDDGKSWIGLKRPDAAKRVLEEQRSYEPKNTVTAYKLFRTKKSDPGKIYPLFIGKNEPTPIGEWVPAEHIPTKGYAERPGWHAGILPMAPHLRNKDGKIAEDRVWAEVEVPADVDWQPEADQTKTRDIRDKVPTDGHYRFKTNKMQGGAWIIGGAVKVKRILNNEDVAKILGDAGETDAIAAEQVADPSIFGHFQDRIFNQGEKPRGSISFNDTGEALIRLFVRNDKKASFDQSTFAHEGAHLYLETLRGLAEAADAPEELKKDWAVIRDFIGAKESESLTTENHEKFASSWEQYLQGGKAPSIGLMKTFQTFKTWLTRIYKQLLGEGQPIPDEVREVMDRMIATDEEIQHAEAFYRYGELLKKEDLSLVDYKTWMRINNEARMEAEKNLLAKQLDELTPEKKAAYAAKQAELEEHYRRVVMQDYLYVAQTEVADDFQKDARSIARRYQSDTLPEDQRLHYEFIAEKYGFSSADEMASRTLNERTFEAEVKYRANEAMKEYAPMLDRNNIKDEALIAIHNEKRLEYLALEKAILEEKMKIAAMQANATTERLDESRQAVREQRLARTAQINVLAARETARAILAGKSVRDAIAFSKYFGAETQASKRAEAAYNTGDFIKAAAAKNQEMLNHALAMESIKVKLEIDKINKALNRIGSMTSDKMAVSDKYQVDSLLNRYGFTTKQAYWPDRESLPTPLTEWLATKEAFGWEFAVPDWVVNVQDTRHWKDLSLNEARELSDAIKNIYTVSRNSQKMLSEGRWQEVKDAILDMSVAAGHNVGIKHPFTADPNHTIKEIPGKILDGANSNLLKVESLCDYMDGFQQEKGPWYDALIRPFSYAYNRKVKRIEESTLALKKIFDDHGGMGKARSKSSAIYIPELDEPGRKISLTLEQRIAAALNQGNDTNRGRLRDGTQWSQQQVDAILDTLTKKDWDLVQGIWDHIDSYWSDVVKLTESVQGIIPKKVEAVTVMTKFGEYRGGYYPLAADYSKTINAMIHDAMQGVKMLEVPGARGMTRQNHLKERAAQANYQVRLDLDVISQHLENVIHDLEFRRAVIDANRIVYSKDMKVLIPQMLGIKYWNTFDSYVKRIAVGDAISRTDFEKAAAKVRGRISIALMAFKASVLFPQVLGYLQIGELMGYGKAVSALANFAHQPWNWPSMIKEVYEKSPMMRERAGNVDRDVRSMMTKQLGEPLKDKINRKGFWVIGLMDQVASVPCWREAYNEGLKIYKGDETKAVEHADSIIRQALGSGLPKDLPMMMSGSEFQKWLTMFHTFGNAFYNITWRRAKITTGSGGFNGSQRVGGAFAFVAINLLLQPILNEMLAGRGKDAFSDDDEKFRNWFYRTIGNNVFSMFPGLRDVTNYAFSRWTGEYSSYRSLPLDSVVKSGVKAVEEAGGFFSGNTEAEDALKALTELASYLMPFPQQFNITGWNLIDALKDDDFEPRDILFRKEKK